MSETKSKEFEGLEPVTPGGTDYIVPNDSELAQKVVAVMTELSAVLTTKEPPIAMNAMINYMAHTVVESGYQFDQVVRTFALACHVAATQKMEDERANGPKTVQ